MNVADRLLNFAKSLEANGEDHGPKWACLAAIKGLRGGDAMLALREAMDAIDERWPGRVTELRCDDDHAAGSSLWVITHENPSTKRWIYGDVTFIYIAQLGDREPAVFCMNDAEQRALRVLLKTLALRRRRNYTHEEYDDDTDFAEFFGDDL